MMLCTAIKRIGSSAAWH